MQFIHLLFVRQLIAPQIKIYKDWNVLGSELKEKGIALVCYTTGFQPWGFALLLSSTGTLGKYPQGPKFSTKDDFWVCSSMRIKVLRNKSKSSALCSIATIQLACKQVKALKPDALPRKTTTTSKLWKISLLQICLT